MQKIPENFTLNKYGLTARLVNEGDAEFIVSLRADPKRTKYMVTLENDVNKQKKWIAEYKKREKEGTDYYFIFSNKNNERIGVYRITKINYDKKDCKGASWIVIEGLGYEAIKMLIIKNEIAFDLLNLNSCWGEVHKENSNVLKIFGLFGYKIRPKENEFYHTCVAKEDFSRACQSEVVKKLIGLK